MLELPRLTLARQRRVAQSLRELADDKAAIKALHADVRASLARAVEGGARLDPGRELPPLTLDNAADTVFGAFEDLLDCVVRGMDDRVIKPLTEEQAKKKAAASTLKQRVFPDGAGFLTQSMALQYRAMREAADKLRKDAECAAAVRELDLGWFVEHLDAHLAPYGRAVKSADNRDLEAESDAFHEAVAELAVLASAHHGKDADARRRLFSAYETELDAQRKDERESRRRSKKKKEAGGDG